MAHRWDLLVVGGGTAGIVAAKTAAGFGASVLLAEPERTGGDCLWTGCVQSKALLAAADAAATAHTASPLGVHLGGPDVDFGRVMRHVHGAIATIEPQDSAQTLRDAGVHVAAAALRFTGSHTALLLHDRGQGEQQSQHQGRPQGQDEEELVFDQAVICTGSNPSMPPIPGLEDVGALTSDNVWDLTELPERLVVIGGGNIGCELGQAFGRLGAEVTLIEAGDRILEREDPRAAALVTQALRRDGVQVRTGAGAAGVTPDGAGGVLELDDGTTAPFDRILVATGRVSTASQLGLDQAGVTVDERGWVQVNQRLRTSASHIWAAGDVTGLPQFTHLAGVAGSVAASNAILGVRRKLDTATVPRVTYTDPEVAAVGVEAATAHSDPRLRVVTRDHAHVDRAVTEANTDGYTSLVLGPRGRLLGATVVGPRAGEALAELTLAVKHRMRSRDLAGTTHAYPTYSDGPWNAAIEDVRSSLARQPAATAVRLLATARRAWVRARVRTATRTPTRSSVPR